MTFRLKSTLICMVVCWPLGAFVLWYTDAIRLLPFEPGGFLKFLFYALGGLIFSVIITLVSSSISPAVRAQNAIESEKEKNGYSDRYIQLVEKEVDRRVKNGSRLNSPIYFGYIFNLCNAYLVNDNPIAARDVINRIDPEAMKKYTKPSDTMAMLRLMQYFDAQICVCEDLRDYDRLERVFLDVKPYIETTYKRGNPTLDFVIDEMYCTYSCMHGLFDDAMGYANDLLNSKLRTYRYVGYHLQAKVYRYMGNFPAARNAVEEMRQLAKAPTEKVFLEYEERYNRKFEAGYSQNIL